MAGKVLIVATSYDKDLGKHGKTGCWVEEVASPYFIWRSAGLQVDIASITGGPIPWDPASTSGDFLTNEADAFLKNEECTKAVAETKSVSEVLSSYDNSYDAIFIPGGHGIVFDGNNEDLQKLIMKFWENDKVVAAVCHGPAALTFCTRHDGSSFIKGKRVTGFTNSEERAVQKDKDVPFLLESKMMELGAVYESVIDWHAFAIKDGNLITGQNPQSSKRVADFVIDRLMPGTSPVKGKGEGEGFHHRGRPVTSEEHHDHNANKGAPHHPQYHSGQAHQSIRQFTHTSGNRGGGHPDKSYTG